MDKKDSKDTIIKLAIYAIVLISIIAIVTCAVLAVKGYEGALLPLNIGFVLVWLIYIGMDVICKANVSKTKLLLLVLSVIGMGMYIAWVI